MKRDVELLSLLVVFIRVVAVPSSCDEKDKAPVFEELKSERIAAYYGDRGLIVPGSQFVCRAYEKADFELICDAFTSDENLKKFKAFFNLVDFKDPALDAEKLAEARLTYEGLVTDDNPTYVFDPFASEREVETIDNFLAEIYGLTIDPSATVPIGDVVPVG